MRAAQPGQTGPRFRNDSTGTEAGRAGSVCRRAEDERNHWGKRARPCRRGLVYDVLSGSIDCGVPIDLLCGADNITLARRADVAFSIPIFPGGIGALLRADASPRLRDVLSGRGTTFHPTWRASASQALQSRAFVSVAGTTGETWLAGRVMCFRLPRSVSGIRWPPASSHV